jgi:hypothetical protein
MGTKRDTTEHRSTYARKHIVTTRILRESGAIIGKAGSPVLVRNPADEGVQTSRAPFMRADLPIAGFSLIDAASVEDAIEQVAKTPCAVAYGVVEIWPLEVARTTRIGFTADLGFY